jgi:hypothetical protein
MGEYDGILVPEPSRSKDKVAPGSHYKDGGLKYGRSRDWGMSPRRRKGR